VRDLPPDALRFTEVAWAHGWRVHSDWAGFGDEQHWIFACRSNASITPTWSWTRGTWSYRGAGLNHRDPTVVPFSVAKWRAWERTGSLGSPDFDTVLRLLTVPNDQLRRFCDDEVDSVDGTPDDNDAVIPF